MTEHGRELRVADYLREELAGIIGSEMRDPRVTMVTLNDVRVSRDLGYADVYVTSFAARDSAEREALVRALNGAAGYLRTMIARRSTMRTTPRLRFHYDEVEERGQRLDALIDRAVDADRRTKLDQEQPE